MGGRREVAAYDGTEEKQLFSKLNFYHLRTVIMVVFLCLIANPAMALPTSRLIESFPVTSGAEFMTYQSQSGDGTAIVYALKIDLSSPYLMLNTMVGADGSLKSNQKVTDMALRSGAVAAVNGDFFQMQDSGRPIGLTYSNGSIITSPAMRSDMYGFAITGDKQPVIDIFTFSGSVKAPGGNSFPLSGINKPAYLISGGASSDINALHMYNSSWGGGSRGNVNGPDGAAEVVVAGNVVREIRVGQPPVEIPAGGYVLMGHGTAAAFLKDNFKTGAEVQIEYAVGPLNNIFAAVGGQAILVKDGVIPNYFTQEIKGRVARTAAGFTADGKTLYLACAEKSAKSQGMTQWEMAYFMQMLGVYRAVNLDGGGSTTMVARRTGEEQAELFNVPEKGALRAVPDAIGIFSTAPPGDFAGLVIHGPEKILVGLSASFQIKGYDEYYNPYRLDPGEVTWSVESGKGEVKDNQITFETGGELNIAAHRGGYEKSQTVKVYGDEDINKIVVEPASISIAPGGSAQIKVSVLCHDATVFDLKPGQFEMTAEAGTISGNTFVAPDTPTAGEIYVAFRGFSAAVPFVVAEQDQAVGRVRAGQPLTLNLGGYFSVTLPADALPDGTSIILEPLAELPGQLPAGCEKVSAVSFATDSESPDLSPAAEFIWKAGTNIVAEHAVYQWSGESWQPLEVKAGSGGKEYSAAMRNLGCLVLVRLPEKEFSDMGGHWAAGDVSVLASKGIVSGFPGDRFLPQEKVTRVQFATMLAKAMGWQPVDGEKIFTDHDVIPVWARGYVAVAVEKGAISGYKDGSFMPARNVTRSEMASMISRALSLADAGTDVISGFQDSVKIDKWALDPVARSVAAGLFRGDNHNMFNPAGFASRAESAAIVARSMEYSIYSNQIIPIKE
jgi:exopolysaccharide biosynthesis protein